MSASSASPAISHGNHSDTDHLAGSGQAAAAPPSDAIAAILHPMTSFYDVWNSGGQTLTLTYSFISSRPTDQNWVSIQNPSLPGATLQQLVRDSFRQISEVIAVNFVELPANSGNQADIRIINGSYNGLWGYAQYFWSSSGGQRQLDSMAVISPQADLTTAYGRNLVLHELGHTLLMKHAGNYDSSGGSQNGPFLPTSQDNGQYTIQSYNLHPALQQHRDSLGLYDVAALQHRWGANTSTRTGDTVYSSFEGRNTLTIWDGGGNDTLNFQTRANNMVLDLRDGAFSTVAVANDLAIAYGVVIENAVAGSGNDRLTGNAADNRLTGGGGNDTIDGGAGIDTAVFTGLSSQHTIKVSLNAAGIVTAVTVSGASGTDELTNVEWLEFSDTRIAVSSYDSAGPGPVVGADIFRFYNSATGTHFYTANPVERDQVIAGSAGPTFAYEGKVFSAPDSGASVWRFYNVNSGTHFYTVNSQERDHIRANLDYMLFEGEAYKAAQTPESGMSPLYRFYNAHTGAHFFTADSAEMTSVRANLPQFEYEGIAYYII